MARFEGRPHWGKRHGLGAAELESLYPRWGEFQAARDRLDPDRRFANGHLEHLLGPRHRRPELLIPRRRTVAARR